jgi:hypothetical protein
VIRSQPSDLNQVLSNLPGLVVQTTAAINRVNRALSDENLNALAASLSAVRTAADALPAASREGGRLLADTHEFVLEAQTAVANVNAILTRAGPDFEASAVQLHAMSNNLGSAATRVDGMLARHERDFDRLAGPDLDDLEVLVRESRDTAVEVHALARALREEPSRVLYRTPSAGVVIPP